MDTFARVKVFMARFWGAITKDPTGFPNTTDSTLSYDEATQTITLAPTGDSFWYMRHGVKVLKGTNQTVAHTDATAVYWIYFDANGVLTSTTSRPGFALPFVTIVYFNTTTQKGIHQEERHTFMPHSTHERGHDITGTVHEDGLGLSGYTLDTASDAAVTFGWTSAEIHDEDLHTDIPADADPGQAAVFYRDDAGGPWVWDTATDYTFKNTESGRMNYNSEAGGTYGQTEVTDNYYVATWFMESSLVDHPTLVIQGQREDQKLVDAQNNNVFTNMVLGDFVAEEFVVAYRLIWRTKSSFGGTRKAKLIEVLDLRRAGVTGGGSTAVTTGHNALADRSDPNSHPASAISVDASAFSGNLGPTDTDAQKAFETLNAGAPATTVSGGYVTRAIDDLLYLPDTSNRVFLYESSVWTSHAIPDAGITVACTGLSTDTDYYLYVYDNIGTLTLDLSTATPTTQDNIGVKTGATDRLFVARCYADASGAVTTWEQDATTQLVNNVYNKRMIHLVKHDTTANWTYDSATWRQQRGSILNQLNFVGDGVNSVSAFLHNYCHNSSDNFAFTGIALDATNTMHSDNFGLMHNLADKAGISVATYGSVVSAGYHFLAAVERAEATTGNAVLYIGNSPEYRHSLSMELLA